MNKFGKLSEDTKGLILLKKLSVEDSRGQFHRLFCADELAEFWGGKSIVQVNHSMTRDVGSFRGLHFQYPPHAEIKLVQCLRGKVLDVALDLRCGSKTFLNCFTYELSAENRNCIVIPAGFAHGFQVLEPNSELIYFHSAKYVKESESGINYNDPKINLVLPLPVTGSSIKDKSMAYLDDEFKGIVL